MAGGGGGGGGFYEGDEEEEYSGKGCFTSPTVRRTPISCISSRTEIWSLLTANQLIFLAEDEDDEAVDRDDINVNFNELVLGDKAQHAVKSKRGNKIAKFEYSNR